MKPEEIAALRQLSEWLQEPACGEDMLASENVRKIVIAAKSVGPLLEHIDLQAEQITQANHRYTELQNVCDDQEKEIKRLGAERAVWIKHYQDNRKKHAALKKLGEMVRARGEEIKRLEDALVEERLSRNSKNRACLDGYGPEYDTEEFAREQLRAEGVIR